MGEAIDGELTEHRCPGCGAAMVLRLNRRLCYPDGSPRKYLACRWHPGCRHTHSCHPDGRPVGVPANKYVCRLRTEAHGEFERWRAVCGLNVRNAYRSLSVLLGVSEEEAHVGTMDARMCRRVMEACSMTGREASWEALGRFSSGGGTKLRYVSGEGGSNHE